MAEQIQLHLGFGNSGTQHYYKYTKSNDSSNELLLMLDAFVTALLKIASTHKRIIPSYVLTLRMQLYENYIPAVQFKRTTVPIEDGPRIYISSSIVGTERKSNFESKGFGIFGPLVQCLNLAPDVIIANLYNYSSDPTGFLIYQQEALIVTLKAIDLGYSPSGEKELIEVTQRITNTAIEAVNISRGI